MRRLFVAGIVSLLLGIIVFNFFAFSPRGLRITNLSDQSATISWFTTGNGKEKVFVSTSNWKVIIPLLRNFLSESFQEDETSKTHYVTIKNLSPEKKYYFGLSGSIVPNFFVTKSPSQEFKLPMPAYGLIMNSDRKTNTKRAILYFNDSFSTVTNESGGWSFDLSRLPVFPPLVIEVISKNSGTAKVTVNNNFQPVPTIYLK
ncbi:fibronectin type III domain-containing protein [Candidatus Gottesmanbacteria bacterium]|nr:fibronectin type III domain-containing protein [Candidatus Gottesmanbacteria bacterium]